MSIQEARMKAYEEWEIRENGYRAEDFAKVDGCYRYSCFAERFACWNAALDSVVIELPPRIRGFKPEHQAHNAVVDKMQRSIESAGLKVKP